MRRWRTACACWSSLIQPPRSSASPCTRRRLPLRAGGPHGLCAPLRAPDVPGQREPREARALPARPVLGRRLQRLHPPGLHRLLRGAARRRARTGAVPGGRPAARADPHRGQPAQPDRRRQRGDPAQRPQPAIRRVPLDPAAARPLRHVPQRAQRLRRLHRAGAGLARRRRGVLRHLLRARQRAGHGGGLPRRRRGAPRWSRSTSATSRPGRRPPAPSFAEPDRAPSAARPCPTRTPRCPRSRSATACPDPADDLDGYLGHALLGSVLGDGEAARLQRRLVHADGAGHRRLRGRGPDGAARRPRPRHVHGHGRAPRGRRPGPGAERRSTRSWTSSPRRPHRRGAEAPGRALVGGASTRRTTA